MSLFSSIPDLLSLMFVEHTQSYSNPPAACDYLISADREFVHALTNQTREQQSVRRSLLHSPCAVAGLCWCCWDVLYKSTKDIQELLNPLCHPSVCLEQPNTLFPRCCCQGRRVLTASLSLGQSLQALRGHGL